MSAPAIGVGPPVLRIRNSSYPVLLPKLSDPRLHLAAVIITLHVLGQLAFDFRLSIAQILIAVLTSAVLEVAITFRQQKVIMWPASALLTGNGVAFILRVPGTEHGDWWSTRGWWIFAGASAVSLLSKYVIKLRGGHVFNPSNFGLVLCFLLLGAERADPLDFWWGPMSAALAFALAIIVAGGLAILVRLRLLGIALVFWVTFAAGLAVLAASGHAMTARWHVGPVADWHFWRVLVFSPEILVFLFFMITDPKTIPAGRLGRRVYAVAIGVLAVVLIAPQTTEFGSKVAVLGALALVCAARPLVEVLLARGRLAAYRPSRAVLAAGACGAVVGLASLVVVAGSPARPSAETADERVATEPVSVSVRRTAGIAPVDRQTAERIAGDVVSDLRAQSDALRRRDRDLAAVGADGPWLASIWSEIRAARGGPITVPHYRVRAVDIALEPGEGQSPPTVVARVSGTVELVTYEGAPAAAESREAPERFTRTFELRLDGVRYLIVRARGAQATAQASTAEALGGVRLEDVAARVGLDFRHGAFRFGMSSDTTAMMGGGLCWLDYDDDGWLDLFVVNSYSDDDFVRWEEHGGLPRSALFHNVHGRFENVSRRSGADLQLRGSGCVAADFNLDGQTDLYVTTAGYNVATDGYDALLWGNGDGTFTEGAVAAGISTPGWHSGAAVGDVNGDGRPDLFVSGYTDPNAPIPSSAEGFPSDHRAVRDLLYLNTGVDEDGRSRFREVGARAGLEPAGAEHGLGAVFADVDDDGRLDLYVANDEDPNRLYLNVADDTALGFRFEERGRREGVADPNAGMGVAAADYDLDGRGDLFVTNSRRQLHAVYRGSNGARLFEDTRPDFAEALGSSFTGWGVSWADLDLDADLDLVLANGAIPLLNLKRDAQGLQVVENLAERGRPVRFALGGTLGWSRRVNGRGIAVADYDNDGDLDVAVNSIGGSLALLRTGGAAGHWLEIELTRFAPGTEVTAVLPGGRKLVREVHAGSSYLSSEDPRIHFGLGTATRVSELVVRYPGGRETRLQNVRADRLVVLP